MRDDISEILEKAPRQTSVSTTGKMREAITEALDTFPSAESAGDAIKQALLHWYHNREQNSKRSQLESMNKNLLMVLGRLARIEEELAEIKIWLVEHGFDDGDIDHA